ncbi:MAG TPA: hypothetical protein VHZ78_08510 [Rhizomicrobium sp.]|jgi:hypothetical protein|nr:hypothetical protein [Rhizomicrobium sp.]
MKSLTDIWNKYKLYLAPVASALLVALQVLWPSLTGHPLPPWFLPVTLPLAGALGITVFRVDLTAAGAGTGWKSYATALILALSSAAPAFGIVIPDGVFAILGAAGFGSLGHALNKANGIVPSNGMIIAAAGRAAPVILASLMFAGALGLSACSTDDIVDTLGNVAVATVANTPVPGQAKTVFGAELTFDFLVRQAQHFVDTGLATPAQKSAIHDAVLKAQAVNKAARGAAESGTNAATATLLASLNASNLDFAGALAKLGVPISSSSGS